LFDQIPIVEKCVKQDADSYFAEDLRRNAIKEHSWYKRYILYMDKHDDGSEKPEYWRTKADLALLSGNRVYYKEPFTYPFMEVFDSEVKAERFYLAKLSELDKMYVLSEPPYKKGSTVEVIKTDKCNFEDMFRCEGKHMYSCKEYADKTNAEKPWIEK